MASIAAVQEKLKNIKPAAKNAGEKYCELLDQILKECTAAQDLKDGLEALLNSGTTKILFSNRTCITLLLRRVATSV